MADVARWTCPSCGHAADPRFGWCARCGEQRLPPAQPVWRDLATRWATTLRRLVLSPGDLTAAWRDGKRRAMVPPLALFLALNVVFFVAQGLSGLSVLSIPLKAHLDGPSYGRAALPSIEAHIAASRVGREGWQERFNQRQQVLAKASVLAMVPLFALTAALLYMRRGARPATHWAFALHFYAFALLFLSLLFPLVGAALRVLRESGMRPDAETIDAVVSGIQALVLGWYVSRSSGRVYGISLPVRLALSVVAVAAVFGIMFQHRIAVFFATVATT
jgi:hypothetical protein